MTDILNWHEIVWGLIGVFTTRMYMAAKVYLRRRRAVRDARRLALSELGRLAADQREGRDMP